MMAYLGMSYTFTKTYNTYIYYFLTWDLSDFNSNIVIIGCPFVVILGHVLDCIISQAVTGRYEFDYASWFGLDTGESMQ